MEYNIKVKLGSTVVRNITINAANEDAAIAQAKIELPELAKIKSAKWEIV